MKKMGRTHLVIPDAHDAPGINKRRFTMLGKLILDEKPDVIICLGDFADMASLCSYDRGSKGFEGRRYKKDIQSAQEAMRLLMAPINEHNKKVAGYHGKQYKPELHLTLGNHEDRISRAVEKDAILDGTISVDDLEYEKFGWTVHPYQQEVIIDGVTYCHHLPSGVMARPISGEHPGNMLLNKHHKSCTVGHSHCADFAQRRRGNDHIMGCVAGCFFEHELDYVPGSVNRMYWRGVVIKYNVVDGCYDPHFCSMNTIKKKYLKG